MWRSLPKPSGRALNRRSCSKSSKRSNWDFPFPSQAPKISPPGDDAVLSHRKTRKTKSKEAEAAEGFKKWISKSRPRTSTSSMSMKMGIYPSRLPSHKHIFADIDDFLDELDDLFRGMCVSSPLGKIACYSNVTRAPRLLGASSFVSRSQWGAESPRLLTTQTHRRAARQSAHSKLRAAIAASRSSLGPKRRGSDGADHLSSAHVPDQVTDLAIRSRPRP